MISEFLQGDGQGISQERIETPQYNILKQIIQLYNISKNELKSIYQKKESRYEKSSYELDWLLTMLKIKGTVHFVDEKIKEIMR